MHQHKVFTRTGHEFERNSLRILRATCCPMGEANTGTRARRRGLWGLGPTGVGTNPLAGGCASAPDRCCSAKARLRRGQNDCDRPCMHPGPSPDSICLRAMWWGEPDESRQDVWRPTAGESSSSSSGMANLHASAQGRSNMQSSAMHLNSHQWQQVPLLATVPLCCITSKSTWLVKQTAHHPNC